MMQRTCLHPIFSCALSAMLCFEKIDPVPHSNSSAHSQGYHSKMIPTSSDQSILSFAAGALAEIVKCQHFKQCTLYYARVITQRSIKSFCTGDITLEQNSLMVWQRSEAMLLKNRTHGMEHPVIK